MLHYRAVTRENLMQATFSMQEQCATIRPVGRVDIFAHKAFHDACQTPHARQDIEISP